MAPLAKETYDLSMAGSRVRIDEYARDGAGPQAHNGDSMLLLLPSFDGHRSEFEPLLRGLGRSGLAVDLPGCGDAQAPVRQRVRSLEQAAQVVLDVIAAKTKGRVTLVGHGTGATLAAFVAVERPECVERLVLIAPFIARGPFSWQEHLLSVPLFGPAVLARLGPLGGLSEHQSPLLEARDASWVLWRSSLQLRSLASRLHRIVVPTYLLWGARDRAHPAHEAHRLGRLLGARLSVLDTRHRPHVEQPREAASLIERFLASPTHS